MSVPTTRAWLGPKSKTTAQGRGVTVQLPAPAKGRLQEIDVLYLTKFQDWRPEGSEVGQPRAVAVAFAKPSNGALDTMKVDDTPLRTWLDDAGIEIREAGW